MPSETTTACVSLLVFFRIRRGTFPYSVEDDASTVSQTPTTHYTNTCVKLTIVTHLSFSERIAIANLSLSFILRGCMEPEPSPSQIGEVVQNVKFQASFLKKKSVHYLTKILYHRRLMQGKAQNTRFILLFGTNLHRGQSSLRRQTDE